MEFAFANRYCLVVSLMSDKEDSISDGIGDIVAQPGGDGASIIENLRQFVNSPGNESVTVFLFDNGKLCYCNLPSETQNLMIVRNFGGIFRNEDGVIKGRTSAKMFPSLIATIPREVAVNDCVFIPTPTGNLQEDGSISFEQNYLKRQFETIMNHVEESSKKILLVPL